MIPNIGVSASTSSGAEASGNLQSDFVVNSAGSSGVGGGNNGWIMWLGLGGLVLLGLYLFLGRKR